jgi:integrase/recombinase XerD
MKFMDWSEERALELTGITPFVVRAYVKQMQREYAPATVRQHLVAIRLLFDHLVLAGALPLNPAASVRASPNMVKPQEGGATVLQPDEAGRLLASIDVSDRSGVRDRALLGLMLATRVRVSAITTMDVKDYGVHDGQRWVRLSDSRGTRGVPVDKTVQRALDACLEAAHIGSDEASPLWRTMTKERTFSERRMTRVDVFRMIRRRARNAGIGAAANCDSLRVTGVNAGLSGARMPANERG